MVNSLPTCYNGVFNLQVHNANMMNPGYKRHYEINLGRRTMARLDTNDDAYKILCDLDSLVQDKYDSYNSSPVDYSCQSFLTTSDSYRFDLPQLNNMSPYNSPVAQHNGHTRSHSYQPGYNMGTPNFFQPPPPLIRSTTDPLLSIFKSSSDSAFYNEMDTGLMSKKRGGLV
jgi:hypothetical protein